MLYTLTDAKEQALHTESKTESAGREKIILNIIYFIYVHLHVSTFPLGGKIYQVQPRLTECFHRITISFSSSTLSTNKKNAKS